MIRFLKILLIPLLLVELYICPFKLIRITSGSMEPALKTGSICIVNLDYPMEKIRKGDIVVFTILGGKKAAHRVVEVGNEGFVTKGDANEAVDLFLVTKDNFLGKIIPWKKRF